LLEDWRIGLLNLNGKHERALDEVEKRLKKYPHSYNNLSELYEKAFALFKLSRIEEAIKALKKSIQGSQDDKRKANSLYFLGYIYVTSLKKYEDALNYLKKAYALDSSDKNIKKTMDVLKKNMNEDKPDKVIRKDIPEYEHFFWF
jgi:tetratricopeptide (TPR) repeat protein